jgi:hypothetical protein
VCSKEKATDPALSVGEQLVAWERVVTNPWPFRTRVHLSSGEFKYGDYSGPTGFLARLVSWIGPVFGRSEETFSELSGNMLVCAFFTGNRNDPEIPARDDVDLEGQKRGESGMFPSVRRKCEVALEELAEYYGRIPDAILGCITLYILPCLYGYLGAAVATMRVLRTNVDAYVVRFSDRPIILQNQILGLVAGAVIGLFSAYLETSVMQGIGSSAVAFLAGYNVASLFRLLDDISSRIFRPIDESAKQHGRG